MTRLNNELAGLPSVYRGALEYDHSTLREILAEVAQQAAVFSGSGGALAVAELAAQLHRQVSGQPARATTPLGLAAEAGEWDAAAVLFSAGGRNPDIRLAARAARLAGYRPVVVVSCRPSSELPSALLRHVDIAVQTPSPKDGFLATSSVIAMSVGFVKSLGFELPTMLEFQLDLAQEPLRHRTVIVGGALQRAAMVDLDTRLAETGLSAAQTADLRNFAHGRHVGLARNSETTTVVVFSDPASETLASKTVEILPNSTDVRRLHSSHSFPASSIELVGRSMHLVGATGTARGVDPARPSVARFGRDLYRLSAGKSIQLKRLDATERKASAASLQRSHSDEARRRLQEWLAAIENAPIAALVLDYDGTCCATNRRYEGLDAEVGAKLRDLVEQGLPIAFASGRGKSLLSDTREWIPREYWGSTWVGLYNGAQITTLDESIAEDVPADPALVEAAERLEAEACGLELSVTLRPNQVGVRSDRAYSGTRLLPSVSAILERSPRLNLKVTASGHSVDVVQPSTSKSAVVDRLRGFGFHDVMAIGDQGQRDGNDYELLASTPWSLSVDRVSADFSRCWNLGDGAEAGPRLLLRYLEKLRLGSAGWRFQWRSRG